MNNEEKIINIDDKELPVDKFKNSEVAYDYRKRTKGGFVDAVFLSSIILTFSMWIFLIITLGGR